MRDRHVHGDKLPRTAPKTAPVSLPLTSRDSWEFTQPTPTPTSLQASENSLDNFFFSSKFHLSYPYPRPSQYLNRNLAILEVKGPHLVSSICPPHPTHMGKLRHREGRTLPKVILRVSGRADLRPRPPSHPSPCSQSAFGRDFL